MLRTTTGLLSSLAVIGLLLTPVTGNAQSTGLSTYDSYPKSAGQRTLIDFNDYDQILQKAQAYVIGRFKVAPNSGTGTPAALDQAALDEYQKKMGAEDGTPINSLVRDPDGHADVKKVRPLTAVDTVFSKTDVLRPDQDAMVKLREELAGKEITKAALPSAPSATATPSAIPTKPKDAFGAIQYLPSQEDFHLDGWLVELNSSANTPQNRSLSYTKEVKSTVNTRDAATGASVTGAAPAPGAAVDYKDKTKYLGIRVHFPDHKYNAHAKIGPAFDIPAFDSRGLPIVYAKFDPQYDEAAPKESDPSYSYNGVIHNVKQLKSIVAKVSGRNFPHGFAIRLRDQNHEVSEYFLGYLNFGGWRYLRWENPNYTNQFTSEELFRIPLYPAEIPYIVFDSFVIYRNGNQIGGDFVTAVEWVKVDFDLAVSPDELAEIDIDDDAWWYIIRDRNAARNERLLKKYAEEIDLRMQVEARIRRHVRYGDLATEGATNVGEIKKKQ